MATLGFILILIIMWVGGNESNVLIERVRWEYEQGVSVAHSSEHLIEKIRTILMEAEYAPTKEETARIDLLAARFHDAISVCLVDPNADYERLQGLKATFNNYYQQVIFASKCMEIDESADCVAECKANTARLSIEISETLESIESDAVARMHVALNKTKQDHMYLKSRIIAVISICLGILISFSLVIIRSIVQPLRQITTATEALAVGDIEQTLDYESNDEMGRLATAYRSMIVAVRERAEAAGRMAAGDVNVKFAVQSEIDVLGKALAEMADRLAEKANVACDIAMGNLKVRVPIASDSDTLGQAMQVMVNNLRVDIEERERVRRELIKAREAAEAATRAKSSFLATMSHEIRTPMNGVIGMTELLLETKLTTEQREFTDTVKSSAGALLSIINDVLDYSKIEAGKLEIEEVEINLRDVIEEVGTMMASHAHAKGIELPVYVDPAIDVRVLGDPLRIRQVMVNLVGNSVKFTERGEIGVSIRLESATEESQRIRFSVSDTGIGIPEDRLDRLFKSFSQVDTSTTRKFGGTGLGLAITKSLIEKMGGEIRVKSEEGKGSDFSFSLLLPNQKHARPDDPEISKIAGQRILVGDCSELGVDYVAALCRGWNCDVAIATHFEEVVSQIETAEEAFDTILLDFHMPGSNLPTLLNWMRSSDKHRNTRVILMTWVTYRSSTAVADLGGDAVLPKPIKSSQLLKVLGSKSKSAKPSNSDAEAVVAHRDPENIHILIVEDNPVNQMVAINLLKKAGYRTSLANNGLEALEKIKDENFDLILMDVQMPEMDGYEATTAIREGEILPGIPIIGLTANAMKGDREKCIEAGMDDYLAKPMKPKLLYEMMQSWLNKKAAV
jgi:signal transduction histidine kinase/DNA-binding response OmpR family regulator